MDDLRRTVWKSYARAWCDRCGDITDGVWPETAGARARKHTRETGHTTQMRYEHTTEYKPREP